MLGIIIGVASVITMLAIGQGSKRSIRAQIAEMGSNMIMIHPGADMRGGVRQDPAAMQSLKLDDYQAIVDETRYVSACSPSVSSSGQAIYGSNNYPTSIYGINPDYLEIRKYTLAEGDMFTEEDILGSAKVCVVGKTIVDNLFTNGENPVGQIIRFGKIPFRIIGVLTSKGYNTMGMDQDDLILAPYTTVQKRILAITHLQSIFCSALSEDQTELAEEEIASILRRNHRLKESDDDDFNIRSQQELSSMMNSTTEIVTMLLESIACISLMVGGIEIQRTVFVKHALMPVIGVHTVTANLPHGLTQRATGTHAFHGSAQALAVHRGHVEACRAEIVAFLAFQKLTAAADVSGHAGACGCERFQHRQRLAFGNAGQHGEIKLAHVFDHVHTAGELKIAHTQLFHKLIAFVGILLIVNTAENMQAHIVNARGKLMERVNQGFHIFDGRHAHHRADINPTVVGLQGNIAETFVLNAIGNHLAGIGGRTHANLDKTGTTEQAGDAPRTMVDLFRKHVEEADPTRPERWRHPFGGNDFLFAFTRINAMFRKQYRRMVDTPPQKKQANNPPYPVEIAW